MGISPPSSLCEAMQKAENEPEAETLQSLALLVATNAQKRIVYLMHPGVRALGIFGH